MQNVIDEKNWAVTEFMEADLHDDRRAQRLITIATVLAEYPDASLPEACCDEAMLKATYRFFDNEAIEAQAILESHVEASGHRIAKVDRVLAVQDTTEVNLTHHPATKGQVGIWDFGLPSPVGMAVNVRCRANGAEAPAMPKLLLVTAPAIASTGI